ncbi:MAG: hypothetical protein IJU81_02180 [Bacteroidales bacterium]|nr:hypothetical protein [Bacteroidales bacterium]
MKRIAFLVSFAIAGACLASCGGDKQAKDDDTEDYAIEEALEPLDNNVTDLAGSSVSPQEGQANSSSDWDEILDDYEELVNDYIKVAKKIERGDNSVISEFMEMLDDAESFSAELDEADNMTPAQIARYARLSAKLSSKVSMSTINAAKAADGSTKATQKALSWLDDDDDDDY